MRGHRSQWVLVGVAIALAFVVAFGVSFVAMGEDDTSPGSSTVTEGFPTSVVTTNVTTAPTQIPAVRSAPPVPTLKVPTPAAPSGGGGSSGGGATPSGGGSGGGGATPAPQGPAVIEVG